MNDLTPQTLSSPISSYDQQSRQSFPAQRPYLTASPQPEHPSMEQPARGLGLFECPIPQSQSTVQELPPSPQQSDSWSHTSSIMDPQEYPQTTQQPPDISSAAFDPFSGYFNGSTNTAMMTSSSPEAPPLVFCQTPPSTGMPSHRNSVSSSYSPSETYSQNGAEYYPSKVKIEDGPQEWYPSPNHDGIMRRSLTTQSMTPYASHGVSPITGPGEDIYKNAIPFPMDLNSSTGEDMRSHFDGAPVLPSVNRHRQKRKRTTPEEATHECRVCGKLFKRSYNWKSHMETHNPERKYPHPCTATIGGQPCTKKFQRKTDLDRHYDSVHLKARNHRCSLCGNRFARRDTLRRHTEDGCPKRFELGLRETSAAPVQRYPLPTFNMAKQPFGLATGMAQPRMTSMAPPMSAGPSPAPFPHFAQPIFAS